METKTILGLIGMILSVVSVPLYIGLILYVLDIAGGTIGPTELQIMTSFEVGVTILAAGGMGLSLIGLIKGSSVFAILGIIVGTLMLVMIILFWSLAYVGSPHLP